MQVFNYDKLLCDGNSWYCLVYWNAVVIIYTIFKVLFMVLELIGSVLVSKKILSLENLGFAVQCL